MNSLCSFVVTASFITYRTLKWHFNVFVESIRVNQRNENSAYKIFQHLRFASPSSVLAATVHCLLYVLLLCIYVQKGKIHISRKKFHRARRCGLAMRRANVAASFESCISLYNLSLLNGFIHMIRRIFNSMLSVIFSTLMQ